MARRSMALTEASAAVQGLEPFQQECWDRERDREREALGGAPPVSPQRSLNRCLSGTAFHC